MDIEKLQAGIPIHLERELLEVDELIIEAIQLMEPEAQAKEIALRYELNGIIENESSLNGAAGIEHQIGTYGGDDADTSVSVMVEERLSHPPMMIMADRHQMQRILLNLISNAIKYTPTNGSAIVRASIEEEQFVLEVEDNGYGIAPDELPNIFERFMRASQMRGKVTGTGIGLAVVKSLVNAHNGQVDVTSAINEGTKFTVRIPSGVNGEQGG